MSVFRRKRTDSNGTITPDSTYSVEFRDHADIVHRVAGFTDRTASVELERQLQRLVSLRMSGLGVDVEAAKFLETCPEGIKARLGEWGIISTQRAAAGKGMTNHIADWRVSMEAKGNTPRHIRTFAANM
jgi:hypothetical protein